MKDKTIYLLKKFHLYKFAKSIYGKLIRVIYSVNPYKEARVATWSIFVDCRDPRGRGIYTGGAYSPGTGKILPKLWRASFVLFPSYFIDIGANYGEVSLATKYPEKTKKIYLIEPNPKIVVALKKTIDRHPDNKKIELIEKAISNIDDQVVILNVPITSTGLGSIVNLDKLYSDIPKEKLEVTTVTLDTLLSDINSETVVMKIDVEGAELNVLRGSQNFLKKNKVLNFIEIDTIYLKELNILPIDFFEFLHSLGWLYFLDAKQENSIALKNMSYSQVWSTLSKRGLLSDYYKPKKAIVGDFILFSNNFNQTEIKKYLTGAHLHAF